MNHMLAVIAPVIRRATKSKAGSERKRKWRLDAANAAREREARRKRVSEALKAGKDVPGCRLEQGTRLDIK